MILSHVCVLRVFRFFSMETGLSGEWGSDSVSILSYRSDITGI